MKAKRKSGGARAVEKKHALREAARKRSPEFVKRFRERYDALKVPPLGEPWKAAGWLSDGLLVAFEETMHDEGMPAEQRRDQMARIASAAMKTIDQAKISERLEALELAQEEAENARALSAGQDQEARTEPDLI